MLALVYMLCVLAPGVSFAFADAARAAPSLADESHGLGFVQLHEHSDGPAQNVHKGGHAHDPSGTHAHFGQSDSRDDIKTVAAETPVPANDQHEAPGAHCCGMVCVSALPATVMVIVKPSALTSVCASENYRSVVDNAPPRLYRPPIS